MNQQLNQGRQDVSPEQYKIEVLKSRIAKLVSDYEEQISNYETSLAILNQQKEQLEEQLSEFTEKAEATGEADTID